MSDRENNFVGSSINKLCEQKLDTRCNMMCVRVIFVRVNSAVALTNKQFSHAFTVHTIPPSKDEMHTWHTQEIISAKKQTRTTTS